VQNPISRGLAGLAVVVVTFTGGCFGPDPEAVATCDEFFDRVIDHMNECGFDGDQLEEDLDDTIDCDQAVSVEGDPLACAEDFEDVACEDITETSVEDTLGDCDAEIYVRQSE